MFRTLILAALVAFTLTATTAHARCQLGTAGTAPVVMDAELAAFASQFGKFVAPGRCGQGDVAYEIDAPRRINAADMVAEAPSGFFLKARNGTLVPRDQSNNFTAAIAIAANAALTTHVAMK